MARWSLRSPVVKRRMSLHSSGSLGLEEGGSPLKGFWLRASSAATVDEPLRQALRTVLALLAVVIIGTVLAVIWPTGAHLPQPYAALSAVMGWTYFTAWSLSFFPQVFENFRRRSVVGLSIDYAGLNLLGFTSYAVFNTALWLSPLIRTAYKEKVRSETTGVEASDVMFSWVGAVMTTVIAIQCCCLERGSQRLSWLCGIAIALALITGATYALLVPLLNPVVGEPFTWLNVLYFFSLLKLCVTPIKYTPQVAQNYSRKSTLGFNILGVLLDLTGSLLSLGQVLLTCFVIRDWTVITGNPVRFGLGLISLVFDTIFIIQHYFLYPQSDQGDPAAPTGAAGPVYQSLSAAHESKAGLRLPAWESRLPIVSELFGVQMVDVQGGDSGGSHQDGMLSAEVEREECRLLGAHTIKSTDRTHA